MGAALKILTWPDPRLRRPAQPVALFDDALRMLADDLLAVMLAAPGIGITAPHVGVPQRLVVIRLDGMDRAQVFVNPEVASLGSERRRHPEGSVSMPGIVEPVERPATVTVRYQDLDGTARQVEAEGLLAVCLQHEIDQLDGIFWLERLSRVKRDQAVRRFEKLRRLAATQV
ncbi:peptide deformylase [Zavarzinia sp. CC-PAN008]|uniref:peptide deformylase n=1 Tax=Zavarzinia sp. CC-PAN008 TaxID=3243332 RepID=UPI003F747DAB